MNTGPHRQHSITMVILFANHMRELLLRVVADWLITVDLGNMDSACSARYRRSWIMLLRDPRCGLSFELRSSAEAVLWLLSRSLQITSLRLPRAVVPDLLAHPTTFPSLTTILLEGPICAGCGDQLAVLLGRCPALTALTTGADFVVSDEILLSMVHTAHFHPTSLHFNHSTATFHAVAPLARKVFETLLALHINSPLLCEKSLSRLSSMCNKLIHIGLNCELLSIEALLAFVRMFPALQCLLLWQLHDYGHLPPHLVEKIFKACPRMKRLEVDCVYSISQLVVPWSALLLQCPALETLAINGKRLHFTPHSTAGVRPLHPRGPGVVLRDGLSADWLSELPLQMRVIDLGGFGVDCDAMDVIADQHGKTLEELHCTLADGVGDEELSTFLQKCSLLRRLHLSRSQALTDCTLYYAAYHCTMLEQLEMEDSVQFTDVGVMQLLRKCVNLRVLRIPSSYQVTSAILVHCRNIRELAVANAGIKLV